MPCLLHVFIIMSIQTWLPPPLLLLLHHVSTVVFSPDHGELDPWKVLRPPPLNQHHIVLLQVVSLPGDEDHGLLPVGQAHPGALPVGGVGLLGLPDHGLQHHGLQLGAAESGPNGLERRFGFPHSVHLVQGCHSPGEDGTHAGRCMLGR